VEPDRGPDVEPDRGPDVEPDRGPGVEAGQPARLEPDELPGLARLTITTTWRALAWTVGTALRTGNEILTRTLSGEPPVVIARDLAEEIRGALVTALGGFDAAAAPTRSYVPYRSHRPANGTPTLADLRVLGAALLEQSADVNAAGEDAGHPAYARILSELTPDEARILRLLYRSGPQPTLDVRTYRPLGIGSELVAEGLNMIGEHAGLRRMDRVIPYLTNLNRQGMIDFSREKVDDPGRYQLIEAQPDVSAARAKAGHAPRIVYRSIRLTAFGRDFCHDCLLAAEPNGQAPS
jgi:Abortive infection alpha